MSSRIIFKRCMISGVGFDEDDSSEMMEMMSHINTDPAAKHQLDLLLAECEESNDDIFSRKLGRMTVQTFMNECNF